MINIENENIFETSGIAEKEVFICKFLAHLLNKNDYLKGFLELLDINDLDITYKNITTEYYIKGNERRIDIVIDIYNKLWLPIEVKINADDKKNQCRDYWNEAKYKYNQGTNARICYLKDGNPPSDNSTDDIPKGQIKSLNWCNLSNKFETIKSKDKNVEQFCDIIKTFNKKKETQEPLEYSKWESLCHCEGFKDFDTGNKWNIFNQIPETDRYANVCIDNYPTVQFGIVEKRDDKFDWKSRIWYREMNIEDEDLEEECEKWLNQDFS